MPEVSIIIPVYNSELYLEKCLDSLINQTLKDIEIICIDDGSKDDSLKILNKYANKDSRIKILKQKHKKQGAARNLGIQFATGNYIGFVDSDDWVELNMFEKLYKKAIESESDIVMCNFKAYNENAEFNEVKNFPPQIKYNQLYKNDEILDIIYQIFVGPVCKLIKKSVIDEKNIYFPENIYFEDFVFYTHLMLEIQSCIFIEEPLYNYLQGSVHSTSFRKDKSQLEVFKIIKITEKLLKKYSKIRPKVQDIRLDLERIFEYRYNCIQSKLYKILFKFVQFILYPQSCFIKFKKLLYEIKLLLNLNLKYKKRILLWGASLFLEGFLNKYKIKNKNIIGIIDGNPQRQGQKINGYTIYSSNEIKNLNPDIIIMTIKNNNIGAFKRIQDYLSEQNLKIKLAKNIFK